MKEKALISALIALPLLAQAGNYEITVERRKDGLANQAKGSEPIQKQSQNWVGDVKITNRAFAPSPELEARYIIFVRRQQIGSQAGASDHVEKQNGSGRIASMKPGASMNMLTSEVQLKEEKLDPGWRFKNGGIKSAQDGVIGIWLKLYNGSTEVAEYVNPTTLKLKQKWD